jgi:hypothetical protein
MVHKMVKFFNSEELLAPLPTPKLEDHPFLAAYSIYSQVPSTSGGHSSIHKPEGTPCHGDRVPLIMHHYTVCVVERGDYVEK